MALKLDSIDLIKCDRSCGVNYNNDRIKHDFNKSFR